ncbi:MAG: hypothetical protein ACRETQ_13150 [Gammaproteobacteria bacterium]
MKDIHVHANPAHLICNPIVRWSRGHRELQPWRAVSRSCARYGLAELAVLLAQLAALSGFAALLVAIEIFAS